MMSYRARIGCALVVSLLIGLAGSGPEVEAVITVTGDVTPTYNGTDEPWVHEDPLLSWPFAYFYVGENSTGSLHIDSTSSVQSWGGTIGLNAGSEGTVLVDGGLWDANSIASWDDFRGHSTVIGDAGVGTLTIQNGGVVRHFNPIVGKQAGSTGTVTVTGEGSRYETSTPPFVDPGFGIGGGGAGTLNIEQGGTVSSLSAGVGSQGVVNVRDAGSGWSTGEYFSVSGQLNIEAGASVSSNIVTGVTGHVLITGAGSRWHVQNLLYDVSVDIEDGAELNSGFAEINGAVTVTGAGSVWKNVVDLYIGDNGTGVLNIQDGGRAEFGLADLLILGVSASDEGTVNLTDGTLNVKGGILRGGAGTANINMGTAGRLEGAGTIDLGKPFVQEAGTLAPASLTLGAWLGATNITGDYDLNGGTVEIEMGWNDSPIDKVTATSDIDIATLGTTLNLRARGTMAAGTYTVLETTGGTVTGAFENVATTSMFGINVTVQYNATTVTITLDDDLIFADTNLDGYTGIDDLNAVLDSWNQSVDPRDIHLGDVNHDGFVGIADLNAVLSQWNLGRPPAAGEADIPEPLAVWVLLAGAGGWLCGGRF